MAVMLTAAVARVPAADRRPLAAVDYFGYKGFDVAALRAALHLHEGDLFPPANVHSDQLKKQVASAIMQIIRREPTDVAFVCCDANQHYLVYIGLPGASYEALIVDPAPTGGARLPKDAVKLGDALDEAMAKAVTSGHATEDDSAGYTLTDDPKARQVQLAFRDYALQHRQWLRQVLVTSDADHRALSAQMLGYARRRTCRSTLAKASLDADGGVRNNAIRALEVLATGKPGLAMRIPPGQFIRLLRSGAWLDHNKTSLVLVALTATRDEKLLARLRTEALDSLLEMALAVHRTRRSGPDDPRPNRWHRRGRADPIHRRQTARPHPRQVRSLDDAARRERGP